MRSSSGGCVESNAMKPFWPEILESKKAWLATGGFCPGIGKGELIQIASAKAVAEEQRKAYPNMYPPLYSLENL